MEQSTLLNVDLWSGREKKKRKIGMARKRAENREGSLGFDGAPCDELEQFIKVHLVKDNLERENLGWDLVIGATDMATYMYLDGIIPEVMQYVGEERALGRNSGPRHH
ncbi:hypothetical protein TNCV_4055941 [Trichonephila clavipes]|nr:hypothetical protein TNCV_4055941 [Trichonephila clavipes]